jgi:hypothetical protein
MEFSHPEAEEYRGYIHHRWVFTVWRGRWTAYPKQMYLGLPLFDSLGKLPSIYMRPHPTVNELGVWWNGTLTLELSNGDLIGPSLTDAQHHFHRLLGDDCDAALRRCGVLAI